METLCFISIIYTKEHMKECSMSFKMSEQFQNTTLSEQFQNTTLCEQFQNTTLSEQFENPKKKSQEKEKLIPLTQNFITARLPGLVQAHQ
jgi:hypothetical protein